MLILPVYQRLVMPYADIYFQTQEFLSLAGKAPVQDDKVILLIAKENTPREELTPESFYPIGVSGIVTEINSQGYIVVRTMDRINVEEVRIDPDHSIDLAVTKRPDLEDMDPAAISERFQALKEEIIQFSSRFEGAEAVRALIGRIDTIGSLAAACSPWLSLSNEEFYAILAEDSVSRRTEQIEKMLYENLEVAKITTDAASSQQQEYKDMYREQAIRKQMEFLQKELDEMHPENVSDVERFRSKIAELGMNDTARREAEKVLNRLQQEGQHSQESGMLYDYLDFVTSLSWKSEQPEHIDLDEAEKILEEDHYGLKKVKQRIIQQIAVMNLKQQQAGSILLFVGAPGTGKTSIGRSIAKALHREYARVSLGGVRDEADIRGHRRTYIGAMPGRIMDGIQKSGVSNPVMVLDEIDKLSSSYNGDPASALLEVLDPEQNNTFTDHYMNVPYDLSNVFFICTANSTDTIPEPLLNRMEVISFTGYTPDEKLCIAKEHLLPKARQAMGISEEQLSVSDEILKYIISDFTMEAGVRGLRKRMDTLCRNAAVKISRDPDTKVVITKEDLRSDLDMRPVRHDKVLSDPRPGVVTGLAWTQVGGEILYIETLFTKGDGKLIITGQLGDVMKESAQIAVSIVKDLFPDKADLFRENDLHIHVPEGAVPKDGPSAGITLTTALASLVTGHAVDPHIAMTGEVALRGAVTAIGGLPEKLMAAQRAGVTKVFIPEENVEDLKDVAQEVRDSLEITPVSHVKDVLDAIVTA
ncbi:MAG: endopeptidase La [Lachnospiraceae bacterium]|nr:endopeptidase La [Lachnospiraceae bacterium]